MWGGRVPCTSIAAVERVIPGRAKDAGGTALPDETLMERYAAGDAGAFDELFSRYERRAYGVLRRRVGSDDRASDLYQELFLRVHRAREVYNPERPFAPWFFQIARRLVIDELRRAGRAREVALPDDAAAPSAWEPERLASATERAGAVLGQLSEVERYVLMSAKVAGREYAELAGELGKSVAAVKKLASRAMRRLRAADAG